jgi:Yip1 domain
MAITDDIVESYRRPRALIRRKMADGPREDRALAALFGAAVLIFVAQWPALARAAHLDPSQPLDARLGGALLGSVFLLPLAAYGIAGLSHVVARAFGGRGSYFGARMALFRGLLAIAPAMLLHGLVRGLLGPGPASLIAGLIVFVLFLYLWGMMLVEVERP